MDQTPEKRASSAWYLMPIFFGIIGGIIAWAVTRGNDPSKAKKFLIVGIIFLVIEIVLIVAYFGALLFAPLLIT